MIVGFCELILIPVRAPTVLLKINLLWDIHVTLALFSCPLHWILLAVFPHCPPRASNQTAASCSCPPCLPCLCYCCPRPTKLIRGMQHLSYAEMLSELRLFSLGRLWGDPVSDFCYLKGAYRKDEDYLQEYVVTTQRGTASNWQKGGLEQILGNNSLLCEAVEQVVQGICGYLIPGVFEAKLDGSLSLGFWSSDRCPSPWQGCWNKMSFRVPFHPNYEIRLNKICCTQVCV